MFRTTRNEPFNDIFEASVLAFEQELEHLMSSKEKTPIQRVVQQDDIRDIIGQKGLRRAPFFTYRLGDTSINEDGVSSERMERWGIHRGGPKSKLDQNGKPLDPNRPYKTLSLIPVLVTINVNLYCSQVIQLKFAKTWLKLAVRPLPFILDYDDEDFRLKADLDKSITYSDVDTEKDNLTICQTNAVLHTYIATDTTTKPITRWTVNEKAAGRDDEDRRVAFTDSSYTYDDDNLERK